MLSHASHSGEREQSLSVGSLGQVHHVISSAKEFGSYGRQIGGDGVDGAQVRERPAADLEDLLRRSKVTKSVLAEASHRHRSVCQAGRGQGRHDLSTVGGRHEPCRPIDCWAEVVPAVFGGLAGVKAHPHSDGGCFGPGLGSQPTLRCRRRRECLPGRLKATADPSPPVAKMYPPLFSITERTMAS